MQILGDEPPALEHTEIGHIDGASPKARVRDNGEVFWSLENRDIEGARVVPRVAGLPFSMYGPSEGANKQRATDCLLATSGEAVLLLLERTCLVMP